MTRVEVIEGEEYLWLDDAFALWAAAAGLDLVELRRAADTPATDAGGGEDLERWAATLDAVAGQGRPERWENARALAPRWYAPDRGHPRLDVVPPGWPHEVLPRTPPSEWERFVSGETPGFSSLGLWDRWRRGPRGDLLVSEAGARQLVTRLSERLATGAASTCPAPETPLTRPWWQERMAEDVAKLPKPKGRRGAPDTFRALEKKWPKHYRSIDGFDEGSTVEVFNDPKSWRNVRRFLNSI